MDIIMSIKPKYVNRILNGTKKFEFRRNIPLKIRDVDKIFIYSTSPQKKIVGHFLVKDVYKMKINDLWYKTKKHSGIEKKDFKDYFKDKKDGFAIEIGMVVEYGIPLDFKEIDKTGVVPQSFKYI